MLTIILHHRKWSRFSGGSGAPYWTLPACGLNPRNFTATQAAIIHCEYPLAHRPDPASLPAMIWSTNYGRLISQTVFTLFFAGRQYAPNCVIDGQNIQDYLQSHYLNAYVKLAEKIRDAGDLFDECVIGWDSLNEPFEGFIGWENLNVTRKQGATLKKGTFPTPAQSLRLGMGQPQTLDNYTFGALGPRKTGRVTVDPHGRTVWMDSSTEIDGVHPKWGWKRDPQWKLGECIWAQHGVWDIESGYILRPDYFRYNEEGTEVEYLQDHWLPHWQEYSRRIRAIHPEAIIFIQPPVFAPPPPIEECDLLGRAAYSGHYYDGLTLITRHWNWFNADALGLLRGKYKTTLQAVKVGEAAIRKSLQEQLAMLKDDSTILGAYPTIIGEIGIPFDMDGKRSYGWTDRGKYKGDYTNQERALDASLNAADGRNNLNWTVWTYCPDSSHGWGDNWNMEDLSIWSIEDVSQIDEDTTVYNIDDRSDAKLLRSKFSVGLSLESETAATSMLSLSTLPPQGAVAFETKQNPKLMMNVATNPYTFLTSGARAVRAFCRPWPIKTVGVPNSIEFDIRKAEFSLSVRATPDDRPQVLAEEEELATEIYIPLVHFAHPRYLLRPCDHVVDPDDDQYNRDPLEMSTPLGSRTPSSMNLMILSPELPSQTSRTNTESALASLPIDVLDLLVTVSEGRWEVHGQVLKWYYSVPSIGQPAREYKIHVKRRDGPIKLTDDDSDAETLGGLRWCWDQLCGCFRL
jgi:hypothetical protein